MKRTFRLTALVLALLMLVNLSASATTTGISLDELDLATYQTLLAEATEEDGAEMPVISEPCGENNPFCALVSELVTKPTAQARYEYMMSLYGEEETDTTLEGTMLHYFYYKAEHNAEGLICECDFPSLAPEYQPGALNIHEADCPWTFANLSVAEQYSIVCLMTADEGAPYLATLSAEQMTALETYTAQQEEGKLSFPCDEMPEYCQFDVYSQMTATERYNYFNSIYADEDGEISAQYAAIMLHYGEYHLDSNLICTCGDHPLPLPEYRVGDVSKHEADCPWHFNNLTTGEQYTMLQNAASEEEKANYMNSLDGDAAEKLDRVNKTEYTATSEAASVQISAPAGTFAADYILSAESAALNEAQQAAMDELAGLHVLTTFDISFAELMDEANKLQPTTPVQLTFTVDVSKVLGNTLHVHHLKDNGDGTYTAESLGTVAVDKSQTAQTVTVSSPSFSAIVLSSDCDGSIENGCGINEFIKLNGFEREAELLKYYQTDDGYGSNEYYGFMSCAVTNHMDEVDINELICLCAGYEESPENYHYGDLNHDKLCVQWGEAEEEIPCPWHFNQIPVEDQATVLESLDETARETYLGTLNDDQKAALEAYLKTKLKIQLNAKYGEAVITEWLSQQTVTVEMMQRALKASGLTMVVLEGDLMSYADLYYVYNGKAIAYYQYNSQSGKGEIIEPSCQLVVATVNVETGVVTYALEATAAN